ncbi:hypothetical protein, conserved [Angomonas deanei]|uniref:Uncharacterized protein n=1 Tax=Angomonas deanei TaxID=59799 RepID=A0A7G2CMG2_9TRYP|nr:hypothetical protein, conserved [Angomonas deanei]
MHRLFLFHILRSIQLVKENIISRAMKKVESNNSANNNITVNLLSAMDNNANNNITFISPLCVYHIFSDDDTGGNSKNNNTIWNYFSWRVEWELQVAKRKMKFIKNQYGVRQTDTPEAAHNTVCGLVYKDLPNFWEFLYKKWYARFNSSRWVKRSNTHHYKKYHSSAKLYNNNNSADTGHVCWSSSLLLKTIIEGNISNHTSTNNSANTAVSPPRSTRRVNQNNGNRNHDTVCEAAKSIILNAESYMETCERYIHHTEQPTNPSSTSAYSTYTTDEIAERREQFLKLVTEKRRK